jgi:hypothetical protein
MNRIFTIAFLFLSTWNNAQTTIHTNSITVNDENNELTQSTA